jgi:hypothetical protein
VIKPRFLGWFLNPADSRQLVAFASAWFLKLLIMSQVGVECYQEVFVFYVGLHIGPKLSHPHTFVGLYFCPYLHIFETFGFNFLFFRSHLPFSPPPFKIFL